MNNLEYYRIQSEITAPGIYSHLFECLPNDIKELCEIIQGLMLLDGDADIYDYEIPQDRIREIETRYISKMLAKIIELDNRPLVEERQIEKRFIGSCRDFSTLLCSMLRYKNIPARIRIGFAAHKNYYSDHVILEYWKSDEQRWCLVDPIRNEKNIKKHNVLHNVFDVPRDIFVDGGTAWKKYRNEGEDPTKFGVGFVSGYRGWWYIRNKLIHDLASLNKMEILPWDLWGIMKNEGSNNLDKCVEYMQLFDQIAALTTDNDSDVISLNQIYINPLFKVSHDILNATLSEEQIDHIRWRWRKK